MIKITSTGKPPEPRFSVATARYLYVSSVDEAFRFGIRLNIMDYLMKHG